MPSKKPYIQIRTTDEIIKKFDYISKLDNRSMSNKGETLIIEFIKEYEAQNGIIKIEGL